MQTNLRAALVGVAAYKNITRLPPLQIFGDLLRAMEQKRGEEALELYTNLFYTLAEEGCDSLAAYLEEHLKYDEAPYPAAAAAGRTGGELARAARQDIQLFDALAGLPCGALKNALLSVLPEDWRGIPDLPEWKSESGRFSFESLTEFYRHNGSGIFARHRAFLWEKDRLLAVEQPDFVPEQELVGYALQRNQVIANTRALVSGRRVNNVLLYGESGTGKSATVKSLLGVPDFESLRLIQVDKNDLGQLHELTRTLAGRPQKFILFIDDLAFDRDDSTYSALKTILEGGVEARPANVAVYATSNRRHLVRETFSDRAGDEVDMRETIEEKTALSERFGLRIPYLALDQRDYLALIDRLALQNQVAEEREELHRQALRWVMYHPGRTPRTAQQFMNSLRTGEMSNFN